MSLLGVGFCGGLTTYSAFAVQSVQAAQGSPPRGAAYVVMTVAGCLAMATLGHLLVTA
jgi:CrcB protein